MLRLRSHVGHCFITLSLPCLTSSLRFSADGDFQTPPATSRPRYGNENTPPVSPNRYRNTPPVSPNVNPNFVGCDSLDVDCGSTLDDKELPSGPVSTSTAAPSSSSTPLRPLNSGTPTEPQQPENDCPVCLEPLTGKDDEYMFSCNKHRLHRCCFQDAVKTCTPHLVNLASLEAHVEEWNQLVDQNAVHRFQRFPLEILSGALAKNQNLLKCYECRAEMSDFQAEKVMAESRTGVNLLAATRALGRASEADEVRLGLMGVVEGSGTFEMNTSDGQPWTRGEHPCIGVRGWNCGCGAVDTTTATHKLFLDVIRKIHRDETIFFLNRHAPIGYRLPQDWFEQEKEFLCCETCKTKEMRGYWRDLRVTYEMEMKLKQISEHKAARMEYRKLQILKSEAVRKGKDVRIPRIETWLEEAENAHPDIIHLSLEDLPIGSLPEDADLMAQVKEYFEESQPTDLEREDSSGNLSRISEQSSFIFLDEPADILLSRSGDNWEEWDSEANDGDLNEPRRVHMGQPPASNS